MGRCQYAFPCLCGLVQARIFVAEGIDKVRLTGGEPTLRKDLEVITKELGALAGLRTLAMTTNGIALRRKLPVLRASGMSALNISLDSLREDRFQVGCPQAMQPLLQPLAASVCSLAAKSDIHIPTVE